MLKPSTRFGKRAFAKHFWYRFLFFAANFSIAYLTQNQNEKKNVDRSAFRKGKWTSRGLAPTIAQTRWFLFKRRNLSYQTI